jgi:carbon-monoxide dehydrogenase medium subunit
MFAPSFEYYRAKTLNEALALLRKKKDAKPLAGGHSLLPAMKLRLSSPSALVDISRLTALSGIKAGKSALKVGALTTHAAIAASKDVKKLCPVLAETAALIGDLQVRNRGTIGGSLAHADPAADFPTVIVALGATLEAVGGPGKRQIPAEKFFKDLFTTALKPKELLTAINVPAMKAGTGGAYLKHRHPASSYAVVGVAAVVTLKNGACSRVSLVVGGVTPNPLRAKGAEAALTGKAPTKENFAAAAEKVAEAISDPLGDVYASGEYRVHLAKVLTARALAAAAERAKKQK